jgi:hypothetical protein
MAVEVASAYVALIPSFRGGAAAITKELTGVSDDAGRRSGSRFGKVFASASMAPLRAFGAAAIGLFALDKIAGFLSSTVEQASDLAEAGNKISTIFGDATGIINTFAAGGARELGQSRLEVLNAAATFGVYGKAAGLAGKANADFSTQLVRLGTDLASFYNTSPEQAIEAIGAALRGESEPIRAYGVLLDDATLRQEALRLGLIKTTKQALTPQQRVLAAQAAIMKQTAVAQGDFAKTSGGLANQQRVLAAQWTDLKARLGAQLLPVLVRVAAWSNDELLPALTRMAVVVRHQLGPALDRVRTFFSGLSTGAGASSGQLAELVTTFQRWGTTLQTQLAPSIGPLLDGLRRIGVEVAPLLQAAGELIIAVFTRLGLISQRLLQHLGPHLVPFVTAAWDTISKVISTSFKVITELFRTFTALLRGDWDSAWQHLRDYATTVARGLLTVAKSFYGELIPAAVRGGLGVIQEVWGAAWRTLQRTASGVWTAVWTGATTAITNLTLAVASGIQSALLWFASLPGRVLGLLGDLGGLLVQAGRDLIAGLLRGIREKADELLDEIRGIAQRIRDYWPFSPAKAGPLRAHPLEEAGANLIRQLVSGIATEENTVAAQMRKIAELVQTTSATALQSGTGTRTVRQLAAAPAAPAAGSSFEFRIDGTTDPHALAREALRLAAFTGAL